MESRLVSLFLITAFYGPLPNEDRLERTPSKPDVVWYPTPPAGPEGFPDLPSDENAFRHNLESLSDAVQQDGAKVLLLSFRMAPKNIYPEKVRSAILFNEKILHQIAEEKGLPLAPFPAEVISPENWADLGCHLNDLGSKEKAQHVLPFAKDLIFGKGEGSKG